MKKLWVLFLFTVLLSGVAFAAMNSVGNQVQAQNNAMSSAIKTGIKAQINEIKDDIKEMRETRKELKGNIKDYLQERKELRAEIRGMNITFEKGEGNEIKLRARNHTARTTLNITESTDENNNTILTVQRGDKTREIKIMPDTASERALERLRIKVCNESNNCTIVLKDVPVNKVNKLMYEIQVQRHYKLFRLFKTKVQNKVQVDAENGQVILTKKPWWTFMASEQAD